MAAVWLSPADLAPFAVIEEAKAITMIEDALALAALVAPCINNDDFAYADAARALIRGAILRWNEAGSGALSSSQETAGPFSRNQVIVNRQIRKGMYWPSEIEQLQNLCKGAQVSGAFSIDTAPTTFGWTGFPSTVLAGYDDPAYPGFDSSIWYEENI